jgi:transcriptional repressor NrdR
VPSRLVGDKVIGKLKEVDKVAYIRYAIVYLQLDDLESIQDEIHNLLRES